MGALKSTFLANQILIKEITLKPFAPNANHPRLTEKVAPRLCHKHSHLLNPHHQLISHLLTLTQLHVFPLQKMKSSPLFFFLFLFSPYLTEESNLNLNSMRHYEVIDEKLQLRLLVSEVLSDENHRKLFEIFMTIPCVWIFQLVSAKYYREGQKHISLGQCPFLQYHAPHEGQMSFSNHCCNIPPHYRSWRSQEKSVNCTVSDEGTLVFSLKHRFFSSHFTRILLYFSLCCLVQSAPVMLLGMPSTHYFSRSTGYFSYYIFRCHNTFFCKMILLSFYSSKRNPLHNEEKGNLWMILGKVQYLKKFEAHPE